ncbi:GpE family phage tail protein [Acinetobacter johnsonii]|uniref:GpE family phage tail protein n=1 Tax=Acinetobacter johnsonii TaxID=40214 RepID=UPI003AF63898
MKGSNQFFCEGRGRRLPISTDEVIADLAVVFHWTPDVCDDYELDELMEWHERARARWETESK